MMENITLTTLEVLPEPLYNFLTNIYFMIGGFLTIYLIYLAFIIYNNYKTKKTLKKILKDVEEIKETLKKSAIKKIK